MVWIICLVLLAMVSIGNTINRPVYKVALTQKGYAQFLQYDVETPPLREFTFCTWVRVFSLDNDQSIFTYVANGSNRALRLWLDTGGRNVKISIDDKEYANIPVDFVKDTWRHICLSYQSDHGAWALYIDSRLASCEAAQSVHGHVLPGGGSIIVGYGIANNGIPNGLEGEIFGVNMMLTSTIERNYTIKSHPQYKQKSFHRNRVIGNHNLEYIVLDDMKSDKVQKRAKPELPSSPHVNASKSYIKVKTPFSFFEHEIGQSFRTTNKNYDDTSNEKEIMDLPSIDTMRTTNNDKINFWKIINEAGNIGKFKNNVGTEIFDSETQSLPIISEYETPPPLKPSIDSFVPFYDNKLTNVPALNENSNKLPRISDIETPPPPSTSTKVYGQWTSSKFASSVLNYLKRINFHHKEQKKVPPTIPLLKVSDSFPYSSDIKVSKVRPSFKFQRRNFYDRRLNKQKRDVKFPEINVQIIQDDLRDQIIQSHAQARPRNVKVTNRGQFAKDEDHRFYRNIESQNSGEESGSNEAIIPKHWGKNRLVKFFHSYRDNKYQTILPFLKTLEYHVKMPEKTKKDFTINPNDAYSKILSTANKWHNVKSYSNDYTPRQINMPSPLQNNIQDKIAEINKKLPTIRLKYKPEIQRVAPVDDANIIEGRTLASEISDQSNQYVDSVSIIKYNHGFLPSHDTKILPSNNLEYVSNDSKNSRKILNKNNFNKQVKLGNALNERNVIGNNVKQNKKSFVGGDDTVPEVNRYRSDIDRETGDVPPSLGPKICKNVELYDRLFYVQPDGSIDVTHILSPVREKNIGIEFIMQNYKKCSLENSNIKTSPLLFIDWNRTPVRLFGGAYPKKTTDLCGFF